MTSTARRPIRLGLLGLVSTTWGHVVRVTGPYAWLSIDLLFARDLTEPVARCKARVPLRIREAGRDDLDLIVRVLSQDPYMYLGDSFAVPEHFAEEPYASRLARGEKCYLAFVGDELAHINWTCFSWGDAILGYPIVLRPGEIYTTDALTLPRFRGLGIHASVLSEMLERARLAGCHRAFTMSSLDHFASYKIFKSMGWRLKGCIFSIRLPRAHTSSILRLYGSIEPLLRGPPG